MANHYLRRCASFTIDLVYPKRCASCGRRGDWVCLDCVADVELFRAPWCMHCGVPTHFNCRCGSMPESVSRVRSVGPFDGWLRGAVARCKYHGEWARAEELGDLLAFTVAELLPFDALVPVPLHPSRLRQRGFNQALLVAQYAARSLGAPVEDVLLRTRRTTSQVRLNADMRSANVQGAIDIRRDAPIAGKSIVLVDDVITTGSTLAACAAALIHNGAVSVDAATVAREM